MQPAQLPKIFDLVGWRCVGALLLGIPLLTFCPTLARIIVHPPAGRLGCLAGMLMIGQLLLYSPRTRRCCLGVYSVPAVVLAGGCAPG